MSYDARTCTPWARANAPKWECAEWECAGLDWPKWDHSRVRTVAGPGAAEARCLKGNV
jgi:hypothetical protein